MNPNSGGNPAVQTYDQRAQNLYNAYRIAYEASYSTAGSLPGDANAAVREYLRKVALLTEAGVTIPAILGVPEYKDVFSPDGSVSKERVKVKSSPYIQQGLTTRTGFADQLAQLAGQPADDLIAAAYAACVPPQQSPLGCDDDDVNERKRDLDMLLSAQSGAMGASMEAQRVIRAAIAEGDALTQYVIVGSPMKFIRQRLGLDDATLLNVAFNAMMARVPGNDPNGQGAPKGAAFLLAQQQPETRLGNIARLGEQFLRFQLGVVRSLLQ